MGTLSPCGCGGGAVTDLNTEGVRIMCVACGRSTDTVKTANEARATWNKEGGR